jgi:hypothetical protein
MRLIDFPLHLQVPPQELNLLAIGNHRFALFVLHLGQKPLEVSLRVHIAELAECVQEFQFTFRDCVLEEPQVFLDFLVFFHESFDFELAVLELCFIFGDDDFDAYNFVVLVGEDFGDGGHIDVGFLVRGEQLFIEIPHIDLFFHFSVLFFYVPQFGFNGVVVFP